MDGVAAPGGQVSDIEGSVQPVIVADEAGSMGTTSRLHSLTGMRAIAAGLVALHHASAVWPQTTFVVAWVAKFGYLGVSFFFCLSGFVMQLTWHRGGKKHFFARRFARIYPLAMVGLIVSLIGYAVWGSPLGGYVGGHWSIPANVTLLQSWFSGTPDIRQAWDGVTWSLSCEMFFYACSPFVLPLIERLTARVAMTLVAVLFAGDCMAQLLSIAKIGPIAQTFFYFNPIARLPEFLMGALLCRALLTGFDVRIRWVWLAFGAGAVLPLWIYSAVVVHQYTSVASLVVIPGFLLTIAVAACRDRHRPRRRRYLLATRPMVSLGDVSYSYYVLHVLVLGGAELLLAHLLVTPSNELQAELITAGFLLAALLAAWIGRMLVELPGQRLLRWLLIRPNPFRSRRPVADPEPSAVRD